MQAQERSNWISPEEYLSGEQIAEMRHELIDGVAYAMTGASKHHNLITGNIFREIGNHLKTGTCQPYTSDMKLRIDDHFFYPDVMVVCEEQTDEADHSEYYTESPTLLIEVLSPSTRRTDQTIKRNHYLSIPSLQEYVLIEQNFIDIEVARKSEGWKSTHYTGDQDIWLESISCTIPMQEIYRWVDFPEAPSAT